MGILFATFAMKDLPDCYMLRGFGPLLMKRQNMVLFSFKIPIYTSRVRTQEQLRTPEAGRPLQPTWCTESLFRQTHHSAATPPTPPTQLLTLDTAPPHLGQSHIPAVPAVSGASHLF